MATEYSIKAVIAAVDKISGPYRSIMGNVERATGKSMGQIGAAVLGATNKVAMMGAAFAAAGATAAGAALVKTVSDYADAADDLSKASRRLGMGIGQLQGLHYAADLADVSIEELDAGIQTFDKGLGQMSIGTGKLYKFLTKVSVPLRDQVRGAKDTGQAFDIMAEAISRVQDPAKRNTLAMMAFGSSGAKMTEMLAGGVAGLDSLRAEFRKFGGELTSEQGMAAENYNDALTRVKVAMLSLRTAIGARLLPILQPLVDRFREWLGENHDEAVKRIAEQVKRFGEFLRGVDWSKMLADGREFLATAVALYSKVGGVMGILKGYATLLAVNVATGAVQAAIAVAKFNTALGTSSIALGPIAGIAAACVVIAYQLQKAWEAYEKFSKTPNVPRTAGANTFAPDAGAHPERVSDATRRRGMFYDTGADAGTVGDQRWEQDQKAKRIEAIRREAASSYGRRSDAMTGAAAAPVQGEIVVRVESDRAGVTVSSVKGSGPVDVSASVGRSTAGRRL